MSTTDDQPNNDTQPNRRAVTFQFPPQPIPEPTFPSTYPFYPSSPYNNSPFNGSGSSSSQAQAQGEAQAQDAPPGGEENIQQPSNKDLEAKAGEPSPSWVPSARPQSSTSSSTSPPNMTPFIPPMPMPGSTMQSSSSYVSPLPALTSNSLPWGSTPFYGYATSLPYGSGLPQLSDMAFSGRPPPSQRHEMLPGSFGGYSHLSDTRYPMVPRQPQRFESPSGSGPLGGYAATPDVRFTGIIPQFARPTLEDAVENVQAHLATIAGRLDSLKIAQVAPVQPWTSSSSTATTVPPSPMGRDSSLGNISDNFERDLDDMGLWTLVLNPLSQVVISLKQLALLVRSKNGSPTLIVVRRLCLDISFMLAVLAGARMFWRRIHGRKTEISTALTVLWYAITGSSTKRRVLTHRGV